MKKFVFIAASILMAVSCHVEKQDGVADNELLPSDGITTFYVYAEGNTPGTKTYIDENLQVRWNTGDCITLFNGNTINAKYRFNGQDGDIEGSFERVRTTSPVYTVGTKLNHIYAVYPYRADTKINRAGTTITMTLPEEQIYREHSFGPGANATVAVSDDENLDFKSVGGYLVLRLFGEGVSVSRVTIQGNNHEKIAGKATVAVDLNTNPTVTMDNSASETLSIVCETPVLLGNSTANYTDFWFVLPPTTFSEGITFTVTDTNGYTFTQSLTNSLTVPQDTVMWLSSETPVIPNNGYVIFTDGIFKAYCVEHFDANGDGEISIAEALQVTTMNVNTDNIKSLGGIMSFSNLQYLTVQGSAGVWFGSCDWQHFGDTSVLEPFPTNPEHGTVIATGQLSELNLSHHNNLRIVTITANHNMAFIDLSDCPSLESATVDWCGVSEINVNNDTALIDLHCYADELTAMDVSTNTALTELTYSYNRLSTLDVSNNTALTALYCCGNQLTTLDVSNNTALTFLNCGYNPLGSVDVSNNTALTTLYCYYNQLTTLDVSNNTALTTLHCYDNQLTTLDVSNNTALTGLDCRFNQLATLDVSYNPALIWLHCYGNPNLTTLWLLTGQVIPDLQYDPTVTNILYRRQSGRRTTSTGEPSTSKKLR